MVASCFDITLPNYLQYQILQKYKNHVVRFPVTLYSSPLSIKTQIPIFTYHFPFYFCFVLFYFFSLFLSVSIYLSRSYISFYLHPRQ